MPNGSIEFCTLNNNLRQIVSVTADLAMSRYRRYLGRRVVTALWRCADVETASARTRGSAGSQGLASHRGAPRQRVRHLCHLGDPAERQRTQPELFETPALTTAHFGATIPTLHSPAPHPGAHAGYNYLVTDADEPVVVREVPQRKGGLRYPLDQLANPRSVALMPGGLYPPNIRLYGPGPPRGWKR